MANNPNEFGDAVKDSFKRYADFSGVSTRAQFWYFILATAIASAIASVIAGENGQNLFSLVTFLPTLALSARRLHDVGKSGWFMLVPIYNIVLFATPGKSS